MAIYGGVKVEGWNDLIRTLRKSGEDLGKLKKVNQEAADMSADQARIWSPKVSKDLQKSIRTYSTQKFAGMRAGNNRKQPKKQKRPRGVVPYGNPIHWGWKDKGIKPNPFLSYSAQAKENQWIRLYHTYVQEAINKIKGM